MELAFRAFLLIPPPNCTYFLQSIITKDSVLTSIFFHFHACLKWILSVTERQKGHNFLELSQRLVADAIYNRWKLEQRYGVFGSAHTWWEMAVKVSELLNEI